MKNLRVSQVSWIFYWVPSRKCVNKDILKEVNKSTPDHVSNLIEGISQPSSSQDWLSLARRIHGLGKWSNNHQLWNASVATSRYPQWHCRSQQFWISVCVFKRLQAHFQNDRQNTYHHNSSHILPSTNKKNFSQLAKLKEPRYFATSSSVSNVPSGRGASTRRSDQCGCGILFRIPQMEFEWDPMIFLQLVGVHMSVYILKITKVGKSASFHRPNAAPKSCPAAPWSSCCLPASEEIEAACHQPCWSERGSIRLAGGKRFTDFYTTFYNHMQLYWISKVACEHVSDRVSTPSAKWIKIIYCI